MNALLDQFPVHEIESRLTLSVDLNHHNSP
jgi:hypothetical protein